MAGENRPEADFIAKLEERPWSFDFFLAVRRLERLRPGSKPLGQTERPEDDVVRFCQKPSLAFAPSTVNAFSPGKDGEPSKLFVNFFGLLGPNGPMPLCFTQYVLEREMHFRDSATTRFLDVFNHRMLSHFYRAWACGQQTVSRDRGEDDRFAFYVGSLFGAATQAFRSRDAAPDAAKLHYCGRLVCPTKHTSGLRAILYDYFRIAVEIEEFVGEWIDIPAECCCNLGESPDTGEVGLSLIVGTRTWQCRHRFRIRFGPMNFADYERMLPGGDSLERLIAWVKNYIGDQLSWDLQLILKAEEVPSIQLGRGGRLGLTTWLRSRSFEKDADQLVLEPLAA